MLIVTSSGGGGDVIGKVESSLGLYAVFFSSKLGRAYMDIRYIFQFFYA